MYYVFPIWNGEDCSSRILTWTRKNTSLGCDWSILIVDGVINYAQAEPYMCNFIAVKFQAFGWRLQLTSSACCCCCCCCCCFIMGWLDICNVTCQGWSDKKCHSYDNNNNNNTHKNTSLGCDWSTCILTVNGVVNYTQVERYICSYIAVKFQAFGWRLQLTSPSCCCCCCFVMGWLDICNGTCQGWSDKKCRSYNNNNNNLLYLCPLDVTLCTLVTMIPVKVARLIRQEMSQLWHQQQFTLFVSSWCYIMYKLQWYLSRLIRQKMSQLWPQQQQQFILFVSSCCYIMYKLQWYLSRLIRQEMSQLWPQQQQQFILFVSSWCYIMYKLQWYLSRLIRQEMSQLWPQQQQQQQKQQFTLFVSSWCYIMYKLQWYLSRLIRQEMSQLW